jgi:predicted NAD/FAD-dependent oxidoreductase
MKIKIAVIGAGLSGLTANHILKDYADIDIFDKSRGVGGRLSTRRAAPYAFDHGAQFFTAKTDAFKAFISSMIEAGVIAPWRARFVEISSKEITLQRQWDHMHAHYVGVPSMNAIPKHLSRDLNIKLNTRVKAIVRHQTKWKITDDHDDVLGEYDWVISTTPPEQALAILPHTLPFYSMISEFKMQACFALMLGFEHDPGLAFDAARIHDDTISWLSVNNRKPGRAKPYSLLIHSNNQWADKHIDTDHTQVIDALCKKVIEIIELDPYKIVHKELHCWRYANIEKQQGENHFVDASLGVAVCGDWFIQGRVEAAFNSGFKTAKQIISILGKNDG